MVDSWKVFILLFLIGFFVFSNSLNGEFVHDDLIVLSHSFFSQPGNIFSFFSQPYFEDFYQAGLYRPLTQISFVFNFLFGSSPFGFHLVNVLLHIINSFLVFLLVGRLVKSNLLALIAALLFLVLPIHVEAVTSIVGRAELFSFFFGILTILLWFDSRYFLSAISLLLALLSKESAVAVPAIVFFLNVSYRRGWRWLVWHLGATVLYFILRAIVLGRYAFESKTEFIFNPLAYISFFERTFTALKILIMYIVKVFVPLNLSADYSYDQIPIVVNLFSSPLALTGLAFLGLMIWTGYRILFRGRYSVLDWLLIFFFIPFLVVSNIFFPIGTIMAERLMYLPSLGALMILAAAIDSAIKQSSKLSRQLGSASFILLLVVYGFLTVNRNLVWASREALLTDIFEKSPNSVVAKTEYGILVLNKDKGLAKRLSLEVYEKYPDYVQNLNLRGAVEVQEGNLEEAEKFLERALELRPKHQNTLHNLSRVYFTLGKYQKAEETLRVLASEYGGTGNIIFYALVQAKNGRFDQSRETLYGFFGPEIKDESALQILRGELKELENFYILGK